MIKGEVLTMNSSRKKSLIKILITCLTVLMIFSLFIHNTYGTAEDFFDLNNLDEREEGFYVVKNEEDERDILRTARLLHVGDEYIDMHNRHFRVVRITDDIAWARMIEESDSEASVSITLPLNIFGRGAADDEHKDHATPVEADEQKIAVYHSHGAESYVPSDGEESIDEGGGILEVGRVFTESLEEQGFEVIHSTETHVPHDAGAYQRSRRTKEELMKDNVDIFFDVHRDAVPEEEYLEEVEGQERVQVLLVLGRQNQNAANNEQFAEELKAAADEESPGLVKGILMANGSYNQDMSARSVLLEIGGHENEREQAEESAAIFAGVVGDYFGAAGAPGEGVAAGRGATITGEGGIAATSALLFLFIVIGGAFIFLLISAGSWEEAVTRLKNFFTREFADVLGRKKE